MNYYAIYRTSPDDELTHWKYIKKVKTSGGNWRYIYDDSINNKYENSNENRYTTTEPYRGKTNTKTNIDYYMDGKRFINKKSSTTSKPVKQEDNSGYKSTAVTVYERGALERSAAKGEEYLYKYIFTKVNKLNAKKTKNKTKAGKK